MKIWNISVAPMPSIISMPVASRQQSARRVWKALAGAHAQSKRGDAECLGKGRHLPVERRRGVADRGADLADQAHHGLGRIADVGVIHRGAGPHRKDQHPAQAEGEGQRRRAHHDICGSGAQDVARPALAGGEHVAVGVNGGFRLARGARGEGHQRDVVRRGRAGLQKRRISPAHSAPRSDGSSSALNFRIVRRARDDPAAPAPVQAAGWRRRGPRRAVPCR